MAGYQNGLLSNFSERFNSGMNNPLTHLGMGIMANSQPRYSTNIADLNGGGIGQGLLAGAQSYQQHQNQQGLLGMRQQQMDNQRQGMDIRRQAEERAMMEQQRKQQQAMREQQAREEYARLYPDQAAAVNAGAPITLPKTDSTPGLLNLGRHLVPDGSPQEQIQAAVDMQSKVAASGATQIRVGGQQGFEPQTQVGKTAYDLQQAMLLPAGPVKDQLVSSLQKKLQSSGVGAEAAARMGKYKLAQSTTDAFNTLADASGGDVGLWNGAITKLKGEGGVISHVLRSFSDQTTSETLLNAMSTQMKTQLGTALSGAAIPVTEWPNYEAQIPLVTDSKDARHAKGKTLAEMVRVLEAIERGEKSIVDLNALVPAKPVANQPTGLLNTTTLPFQPNGNSDVEFLGFEEPGK